MNVHIEAAVVNQNTSPFTELMLRSLHARHPELEGLSLTVLDNHSEETDDLRAYCRLRGIPFETTPFYQTTPGNNHGENYRAFVLGKASCDYYLFLDTDVVFIQERTIDTMLAELEQTPDAFGVQARVSWDGVHEQPGGSFDRGLDEVRYINFVSGPTAESAGPGTVANALPVPSTVGGRIHPCCCLIRNTEAFRLTVEHIGLSCAQTEESANGKFYDTFGLMTQVMKTHGLRHALSAKMVIHFVGIACDQRTNSKEDMCRQRLDDLRQLD
ncbi:MAG: hypothetical protein GKR89_33705 [Candidatus Latescibacteria bacterium]|nr:hypothetical protein [Candidatus Latescibacterota bacterium]